MIIYPKNLLILAKEKFHLLAALAAPYQQLDFGHKEWLLKDNNNEDDINDSNNANYNNNKDNNNEDVDNNVNNN